MAKKPEIEVQVQLLFQEAMKKLTNALANATSNIKVGLDVSDRDMKKLFDTCQKYFDEKETLQLFMRWRIICERN
jgi:FMN-dependent NADH-azoreductase